MITLLIELLLVLPIQDHDAICAAAQEMTQADSELAYQILESIEPEHAFDYCF